MFPSNHTGGDMNRKSRLIFLVILILLAWPLVCGAEVTRFWFNVWTTQVPDPDNPGTILQRLDITVQINDTRYRPPDAIKSLKVTAPDKTVFTLTQNWWSELRQQFEANFYAQDFLGGKIPSGTYTATVTDKSGLPALKSSKKLTVSFMAIPKVTTPFEGMVIDKLKPTIKWGKVAGAQYYQIHLNDVTPNKGEPIYMLGFARILEVYTTQFTLQTGVLKPGRDYKLRVEARDSDKNMSRRGRSAWINFSTDPNAQ
jgi:nitrate reductase NapE component